MEQRDFAKTRYLNTEKNERKKIMKNWIVHTMRGDFRVAAVSADRARDRVVQLTDGAVSRREMYVEESRCS